MTSTLAALIAPDFEILLQVTDGQYSVMVETNEGPLMVTRCRDRQQAETEYKQAVEDVR